MPEHTETLLRRTFGGSLGVVEPFIKIEIPPMPLTQFDVKNAKPTKKAYKLSDGGGLYLLVQENGSRLWRMKYRFLGKEQLLSFGAYPLFSLAEARGKRDAA